MPPKIKFKKPQLPEANDIDLQDNNAHKQMEKELQALTEYLLNKLKKPC